MKETKAIEMHGYCRICWKTFTQSIYPFGLTMDGILQKIKQRLKCCKDPDPRTHPKWINPHNQSINRNRYE
jgi:hypothetical protein